jgi:hypothetical protein
MGLDMYLEGRKFVSGYSDKDVYDKLIDMAGLNHKEIPHSNFGTISLEVMYWRKVNAVHNWFVDNVQDGVDDCKQYHVDRDKLVELMETCRRVVNNKDDLTIAEELLPTGSGFFFGDTDYEEYYFEGLLDTIEAIERILKNTAFDGMDFYYQSSW